jgi:hypothetical protein
MPRIALLQYRELASYVSVDRPLVIWMNPYGIHTYDSSGAIELLEAEALFFALLNPEKRIAGDFTYAPPP